MNPLDLCIKNLHGVLDEFREAAAGDDVELTRALIVDLRYAFAYIEEHLSPPGLGIGALIRKAAATYTQSPAPQCG